jgi:hypothetical protein|nr:MAG TPA: structural protein [Caudoviricetes sp.]
MASNILEKYGIKEVADFVMYEIDANGKPGKPVLYLDTLKVSTAEFNSESKEATGGKGNATLISWDSNKEITLTLEDALFSPKSLSIMLGASLAEIQAGKIKKTVTFVGDKANTTTFGLPKVWEGSNGVKFNIPTTIEVFDASGKKVTTPLSATNIETGETYFATFEVGVSALIMDITASQFPGTYYMTGDTYTRDQKTGKDSFFQLVIPKAKIVSEDAQLQMEADGDPSTFQMKAKVLKSGEAGGQGMIQLIKYDVTDAVASDSAAAKIWTQK